MLKKKTKKLEGAVLAEVLAESCADGINAQISSSFDQFSAHFVASDRQFLFLENTLSHLEDVHHLRNRELTIFFPYKHTLLKGTIRLLGLNTYENTRVLQCSLPPFLQTDEKRSSRRVRKLPPGSSVTFSTLDLHLFRARVLNVSLRGMAFVLEDHLSHQSLVKGTMIQADANLGDVLKLNFDAEIRYTTLLESSTPSAFQLGVRMTNLSATATNQLNQWIFKIITEERRAQEIGTKPGDVKPKKELLNNSVLVVTPHSADVAFWHQCLGRKYEILTCDPNISNLRQAMIAKPSLILIYMDPNDAMRASFTRKLSASFANNHPVMFFGEEPDPERQKLLMGSIPSKGFMDTSERKVLVKFRTVEEVMNSLKTKNR